MKRLIVGALACLAFVGVASCETFNPTGSGPVVSGDATTLDERALLGIEYAAIAVNRVAENAVDTGAIQPGSPKAVAIADALLSLDHVVKTARQAYEAGNAKTFQDQVFSSLALIARIKAIVG